MDVQQQESLERTFDRDGAARRLGQLKKTDAYLSLSPEARTTVRLMVKTFDAMDGDGMSPSYATVARKRKLCRRQVMRHLDQIAAAGVFVKGEPRWRTNGSRTSNRWHVNPDLLPSEAMDSVLSDVSCHHPRVTTPLVTSDAGTVTPDVTRDVTTHVTPRSSLEQLKPLRGQLKLPSGSTRSTLWSAVAKDESSGGTASPVPDDSSVGGLAGHQHERELHTTIATHATQQHLTDAEQEAAIDAWIARENAAMTVAREAEREVGDRMTRISWATPDDDEFLLAIGAYLDEVCTRDAKATA